MVLRLRGGEVILRAVPLLRSKKLWLGVGGVLVLVIVIQLLLPYDRALFGATLDNQDVGWKTKQEITALLSQRYESGVVVTKDPDTRVSFKEAGLVIDAEASASRVVDYSLMKRLIPFSSLFAFFTNHQQSSVGYASIPVTRWAKTVSDKCYTPAQDATIVVTNEGTLAVLPSKKGTLCDEKQVVESLRSTPLSPITTVDSTRQTLEPSRGDQEVSAQLDKIQAVIKQGISVKVLDSVTEAEPSEIISWLEFNENDAGEITLGINRERIQPFITKVQQPIYIAPGTTVIHMTDGQETGRMNGEPGRGVDSAALIASLQSQLQSLRTAPIEAKVAAIPPKQDIRRSYTNSAAGLQALLSDLAAEKGDMAIAISELGGQNRSLSVNGGKKYHPASTYKLVVAYSIFKRVEAGQLKLEDQIDGRSVDECLTRMIVNSDNPCAEAFAEKFTWRAIQADARTIGMTGTDLNAPEPVSTVSDQVILLKKLHNNELMKPEHTAKLLDLMKRQAYRAGVPAGVSVQVADKVGFMSGLLHDSAIVYAHGGTYVISVYSKGGTWGGIADVTRRINALIAS